MSTSGTAHATAYLLNSPPLWTSKKRDRFLNSDNSDPIRPRLCDDPLSNRRIVAFGLVRCVLTSGGGLPGRNSLRRPIHKNFLYGDAIAVAHASATCTS